MLDSLFLVAAVMVLLWLGNGIATAIAIMVGYRVIKTVERFVSVLTAWLDKDQSGERISVLVKASEKHTYHFILTVLFKFIKSIHYYVHTDHINNISLSVHI